MANNTITPWIKSPDTFIPGAASMTSPRGWVDRFKKVKMPTPVELLDHFRETAYSCININSTAVASAPWGIYVTTNVNEPKTKARTRSIAPSKLVEMRRRKAFAGRLSKAVEVRQLETHPLIDLLEDANPAMEGFFLFELLSIYLEIHGRAYWHLERAGSGLKAGLPNAIWPLPSHRVTPKKLSDGQVVFEYFNGLRKVVFEQGEIIQFLVPNPKEPFLSGHSPLMGIIESAITTSNSRAHTIAILENKARPDTVVSPSNKDEEWQSDSTDRMSELWNMRFRKAGNGGVLFSPYPVDVTPLTFSQRDLETIKVEKLSDDRVMNAFGIPISMLRTESSNRATADAGLFQHAQGAVRPRLIRIENVINSFLAPLFDDRIFFAFDDVVPANRELDQKLTNERVDRNLITINEWRAEEGLEPVEWGDGPQTPPSLPSPASGPEKPPPAPPKKEDDDDEDEEDKEDEKSLNTPKSLARLVNLLAAVHDGKIPVKAAEADLISLGYGPVDAHLWTQKIPWSRPDEHGHETSGIKSKTHSPSWATDGDDGGGHGRTIPQGRTWGTVLRTFFKKQHKEILRSVKIAVGAETKEPTSPMDFAKPVNLDQFNEELAEISRPFVEEAIERGWVDANSRLNFTDDPFNVTNPKVAKAVDEAAFEFAASTNATTAKNLNVTLEELRDTLTEGILFSPNTAAELTKRVNAVFEMAETWRAARIAITESSRAVHAGQEMAAIESGIVKGFEWLLSANACPICQGIKATQPSVKIGQPFANNPTGSVRTPASYRDVFYPPAHPNCQCTIVEIIDFDAID